MTIRLNYAHILKNEVLEEKYSQLNGLVNRVVSSAFKADPEATETCLSCEIYDAIMKENHYANQVLPHFGYTLNGRTLSWELA